MHEQLARVERLEGLKRFFSPQLAEMILVGGPDDPLKAHRREITAASVGLKGFTAFAAYSEPEEVMRVLGQYHREMGRLIFEYGGTLERFIIAWHHWSQETLPCPHTDSTALSLSPPSC